MTRILENGVLWVAHEPSGKCELCGVVEETRPYGQNGEEICFSCGMKDEKATERKFKELYFGGIANEG